MGPRRSSFSWANKIGGAGDDKTTSIVHSRMVRSNLSRLFRQVSIGDLNFNSSGDYDTLIAKVNPDGTYAWASHIIDEGSGTHNYELTPKSIYIK